MQRLHSLRKLPLPLAFLGGRELPNLFILARVLLDELRARGAKGKDVGLMEARSLRRFAAGRSINLTVRLIRQADAERVAEGEKAWNVSQSNNGRLSPPQK